MKAELIQRLLAVPALAAALTDKIAWDERPRSAGFDLCCVLTLVYAGDGYTHSGNDGLPRPMVQFDVYGTDWAQVQVLSAAIRTEMELGPHQVRDVGAVRFHPGFIDSQRSVPSDDLAGDIKIFGEQMDISFHWEAI
jgi:hypothetical protein